MLFTIASTLIAAGCADQPSRADRTGASAAPVRIALVEYVQPGDQLFEIINKGARDAAHALGARIDIQYASGDPLVMNTLIDASVAGKADGLAVTIDNDDAYKAALCRAQKAGETVVAFNVDSTQAGPGACRSAFFGQNLEEAGYTLGQRLLRNSKLSRGDLVFTPVEFPEASYALLRHRGVARALGEAGVRTEIVGTGNNPPDVLVAMEQYLIGHRNVKAIVTLGSVTGRMAVRAANDAGRRDLAIATFDNSAEITRGILDGRIVATADQQPYAQGFHAVTSLILAARYGIAPADVATGSRGLTDQASLTHVRDVTALLGVYR